MIKIHESNKSKRILEKEKEWGINVEEMLRIKYVDEHKSLDDIAKEIGLAKRTIEKYMKLAHIFSRRIKI